MTKNIRFPFIVKSIFLLSALVLGVALRLGAQGDNGAPAGGAWSVFDSQDKMTAARHVKFELVGNSEQREARGPDARGPYDNAPPPSGPYGSAPPPPQPGPYGGAPPPPGPYGPPRGPYNSRAPRDYPPSPPRVEIFCEDGNYKGANFVPGERIAPPNRPGFWGQPQMQVLVRVNDSHNNKGWNWTPDFLMMDKNTTRELIGAQLFRVEYLGSQGPVIAEFSPAGLDLGRIAKACSLKPKKP